MRVIKKIFYVLGGFLLPLLLLSACGQSQDVSVADAGSAAPHSEAALPPAEVRKNGQYLNAQGRLELPGLDGSVTGDGALPAFLSAAELRRFKADQEFGLPDEAFQEPAGYEVSVWPGTQTGLKAPCGMLVQGDELLVADSEGNCIAVLDKRGTRLRTIGETGNGQGEFLRPLEITSFQGKVHVLDGGNDRIQILNEALQFEDSFQLIRPSSQTDFYNFAYDEAGNLYLSRMDSLNQRMYCYAAGSGAEPTPIAENACGALTEKDGQVYAINYGSSFSEGPIPEDRHEFVERGFETGVNALFTAAPTQLQKKVELPYGISGAAILANADGFLVYSDSVARLLQFDENGVFQKTIAAAAPSQVAFCCYLAQGDDGTIYMAGAWGSELYVITPKP